MPYKWICVCLALCMAASFASCRNNTNQQSSSKEPQTIEPVPPEEPLPEIPSVPELPPAEPDSSLPEEDSSFNEAGEPSFALTMDINGSRSPIGFPIGTEAVTVTIHNGSSVECVADMHYAIEKKEGLIWQAIDLEFMVTEIALSIPPGGSHEFTISLTPDKYDYQEGTYRVLKRATIDSQTAELTAEFNLV